MQDAPSRSLTLAQFRSGGAASAMTSGAHCLRQVAQALGEGRIALALQPVMQARALDRPAFHEGLIRLVTRSGEVVSAGEFIEIVEPTPLGRALDRMALRLAIAELGATPDLRLSINLSTGSVGDPHWSAILSAASDADPTLAERLIIEITERAIAAEPAALRAFMTFWGTQGVSFALDDFGAGFTAYRHLRNFRFDIVKIDGHFSRDIHRDVHNQAFMRALLPLARHFEALVVAEAVECEAEARFLTGIGVDALQGYHFGRPELGRASTADTDACIA
ncbi:MAG: EAL domain-containing protein [Rhodobacteraceae bacterium]|nr:EAL domain-containing protein [Paracoccaceae bacterium]